MIIDHGLRQRERLTVVVVEALRDIPRHLHVLNLVTSDRHFVCIKDQDIRGHQNRIGKQPHRDAKIGVVARRLVGLHRRLVGMRTIHQSFRGRTGQHPAQLCDLRNIRLPVKVCLLRI